MAFHRKTNHLQQLERWRAQQFRVRNVKTWITKQSSNLEIFPFRYEDGAPVAVDAVVLSTQHDPDITQAALQEAVMEEIIKPVLPEKCYTF